MTIRQYSIQVEILPCTEQCSQGIDVLHTLTCPFDKTKDLVSLTSYFINMGISGQLATGN